MKVFASKADTLPALQHVLIGKERRCTALENDKVCVDHDAQLVERDLDSDLAHCRRLPTDAFHFSTGWSHWDSSAEFSLVGEIL